MLPQEEYDEITNSFAKYLAKAPVEKPANDNFESDLEKIADESTENSPQNKSNIIYLEQYRGKEPEPTYGYAIESYLGRRHEALHNFEDRVPGKHVDVLPKSIMGGILGFTYLGQDRMALRDDLIGDKRMVDIHESIHTPNEYETRVLTAWIMSKTTAKYIR